MKVKNLPIDQIFESAGNPRLIRENKFRELVKSLKSFPEMLEVRPIVINPDNEVLGGNMRLRAAKEAGISEVPVVQVTWKEAKQKEFMIKDNVPFGEWDWDVLANEWDTTQLNDWGLPVWEADSDVDYSVLDDDLSKKINSMSREVKRSICIEFADEFYDEAFDEIRIAKEAGVNIGEFLVGALKQTR